MMICMLADQPKNQNTLEASQLAFHLSVLGLETGCGRGVARVGCVLRDPSAKDVRTSSKAYRSGDCVSYP